MKKFIRGMYFNLGIVRELIAFLWKERLWWLIPAVTLLLVFALFLIFASASGVSPFIYSLF